MIYINIKKESLV